MASEAGEVVAKAVEQVASGGDLTLDQIALMEEEGLGPREVIREVKALLACDPSRIIESDGDGGFRLKDDIPPKHMKGVVEIAKGRIKFVDRVAALRLAAEMARQVGRIPQQGAPGSGGGMTVKQAVFLMPGSDPQAIPGFNHQPGAVVRVEAPIEES